VNGGWTIAQAFCSLRRCICAEKEWQRPLLQCMALDYNQWGVKSLVNPEKKDVKDAWGHFDRNKIGHIFLNY
jgi:hypothetical protein